MIDEFKEDIDANDFYEIDWREYAIWLEYKLTNLRNEIKNDSLIKDNIPKKLKIIEESKKNLNYENLNYEEEIKIKGKEEGFVDGALWILEYLKLT